MSNNRQPTPPQVAEAIRRIANDLIDDAILGITFEVHRAHKIGLIEAEIGDCSDDEKYKLVTGEGMDVFGQPLIKKPQECICPNCGRSLAASRFAPHLEKCMGMGRNSSRIASRRIQNTSRDNSSLGGVNCGGGVSDDDADEDWIADKKKRKRDKNSPRRSKKINNKSASDGVSWSVISGSTESEKRAALSGICGVVSEHTRKMCTRSMKCPQHTTNQRRAVREQLFGSSSLVSSATGDEGVTSSTPLIASVTSQDVHVDTEDNSNSSSSVLTGGGGGLTGSHNIASGNGAPVGTSTGAVSGVGGAVSCSSSSSWDQDINQNSSSTSPADSSTSSTTLSSLSSHSSSLNGTVGASLAAGGHSVSSTTSGLAVNSTSAYGGSHYNTVTPSSAHTANSNNSITSSSNKNHHHHYNSMSSHHHHAPDNKSSNNSAGSKSSKKSSSSSNSGGSKSSSSKSRSSHSHYERSSKSSKKKSSKSSKSSHSDK